MASSNSSLSSVSPQPNQQSSNDSNLFYYLRPNINNFNNDLSKLLTLSRHFTILNNTCDGYKPPKDFRIVLTDNYNDINFNQLCLCGQPLDQHNIINDDDDDDQVEFNRLSKVAFRIDELLNVCLLCFICCSHC